MKLAVKGENPLEAAALALGIAPLTLVDTHMAFLRARAIMVATRLGIFDALGVAGLAADELSARCGMAPGAAPKLLNALVASGYLRFRDGRYQLTRISRKWLRADSPYSVRDKVLFEFFEWSMVEGMEDFVRSGRAQNLQSGALGSAVMGAAVVFAAHAPARVRAIVDGPVHVGPALLEGGGMGAGVGGRF